KDRLQRGVKPRAGPRLEIKPKAAPDVLFAPLPNAIRLHSRCALLAAEVASTGSGAIHSRSTNSTISLNSDARCVPRHKLRLVRDGVPRQLPPRSGIASAH